MPDFNKGDFTQQGVNSHVNATVRLNEKRLVNIDLTSNEEAEGCTITGSVKDLLNDKVYNIGSGGGGGGLPTCQVTLVPDPESKVFAFTNLSYELIDTSLVMLQSDVTKTTTKNIPYRDFGGVYVATLFFQEGTIIVATNAVNCQWDNENGGVMITDEKLPSSITLTGYSPK